MRIGFGIFVGEALVVMAYLGTTPHGSHRAVLWPVVSAWLVCGAGSVLLAPTVSSKPWRARFSATWTIVSALAVGGVASLDGGIDSPTIFMLFLPVAFAALAFTPWVAGWCGGATLVSATFVVATDATIRFSQQGALVLFGVLAGATVLSVAASVNRTQRERHERVLGDEVAHLAATDGLTGCAVHRVFHERLEEEIARSIRYDRPLSLLMIDVDRFKSINDTYGHLVGDHVLAAVGAMLRAHARRFDLVGRLGGDEFAVLMPDTESVAAAAFAERIGLEASVSLEAPVTLSVGVSGLDKTTPTAEHMLDDADFALYQVKGAGRDGVAVRAAGPARPRRLHEPEPTTSQ
jgi:diguanylate cyclase (GGDEF)-like protein